MKALFLSLKRCVRTVYFPILLCVLVLALTLIPAIEESQTYPPAGFCDLDKTTTTERISDYLIDMGFVRCDSEDELYDGISEGRFDCGFVFDTGFEKHVLTNSVDGAVPVITSPMSYAPSLWQNHVSAAVFAEITPVISASAFTDSEEFTEALNTEYRRIIDEGTLFSFRLEMNGDTVTSEELESTSYVTGAMALLIFALMMYAVCDALRCDAAPLVGRIGAWKTTAHMIIPDLVVRIVLILLAYAVSALISGAEVLWEMLVPCAVFTLLSTSFAIFIGAFLRDDGRIRIFTFYMLTGALLLCPIVFDAAMLFPWIAYVRFLFPPYWLWLCGEHYAIIAASIIALPVSVLALTWRLKGIQKCKT